MHENLYDNLISVDDADKKDLNENLFDNPLFAETNPAVMPKKNLLIQL